MMPKINKFLYFIFKVPVSKMTKTVNCSFHKKVIIKIYYKNNFSVHKPTDLYELLIFYKSNSVQSNKIKSLIFNKFGSSGKSILEDQDLNNIKNTFVILRGKFSIITEKMDAIDINFFLKNKNNNKSAFFDLGCSDLGHFLIETSSKTAEKMQDFNSESFNFLSKEKSFLLVEVYEILDPL